MNEIAKTEPNALATLLGDPEKLAAVPVDTVERLWAIDREIREDQARREYYAALNRVQKRLTEHPVIKDARNTQTGSMFARAEKVDATLDPILTEEGFSCSTSTAECPLEDHIRIEMRVFHVGGHSEIHHLDAPIDDRGAKGAPTKTRLHGMGSTMTYVRRYLRVSVFGVQIVSDDDGNRGRGAETITADQVHELVELADDVGADNEARRRLLAFFKIGDLNQLPAVRFREAKRMLEQKRER